MTEPWNEQFPGLGGILDTPEMRRQRVFDTLTGLGTALYAASQPSPYPRDVIGPALIGMAANSGRSEESAMRRAMLGMQVQKQQAELKEQESWAKMFGGGAAPDAAPAAAPEPMPQGGDYFSTVRGDESGNKFVANAKGSGAWGPSQITPDTWATIATKNPHLGLPFNMRQAKPEQYEAAEKALAQMNASALQAHGIQPTATNLYFAHRFGPQGAKQFLSADPNTPIPQLFPSWIAQNPDLNTTVGEFRQRTQGRYGGIPSPVAGPQVAQGDGTVVPAQYSPQAPQQPRNMQEVIESLPPALRQFIGALGPKEGRKMLGQYAFMTPAERERLRIEIEGLRLRQTADQRDERKFTAEQEARMRDEALKRANSKVLPDGQANPALLSAEEEDAKRKARVDLETRSQSELIQRRADQYEREVRPKAQAAGSEISAIHQVRQLLDAGAFTGMGAGAQAFGSRLAQTLGIDWGADQQANTAALQSAMALRVLPLVKNLGAGAGISNADREYAAEAAGGKIEVGEKAIRRILDIGERAARATLKSHDADVSRLRKLPGVAGMPDDYFSLSPAPTYDEWARANPLPQPAPQREAPQGGSGPQQLPVPPPDGKYEYRRGPNGQLQRRALQ